MTTSYTRRECLAILASTAMLRPVRARAAGKPMRGAFMILSTLYTEAGAVDWDDLVRETEFVVMKKRGIFKTTITGSRGGAGSAARVSTLKLTADQVAEIEYRFAALKPYLS